MIKVMFNFRCFEIFFRKKQQNLNKNFNNNNKHKSEIYVRDLLIL